MPTSVCQYVGWPKHLRHSNENGGRYLYLTQYYCGYGQKPHSIWMGKNARSVACRKSQTAIWICLKRQLSVTSGGTDANVCVPVCWLAESGSHPEGKAGGGCQYGGWLCQYGGWQVRPC